MVYRTRNKWKHTIIQHYLVSDPPFSCLASSVAIIIMSVSACKHKLVQFPRITGYLYISLCRATALCMHIRGLCVAHVTNGLGEQHLCKVEA